MKYLLVDTYGVVENCLLEELSDSTIKIKRVVESNNSIRRNSNSNRVEYCIGNLLDTYFLVNALSDVSYVIYVSYLDDDVNFYTSDKYLKGHIRLTNLINACLSVGSITKFCYIGSVVTLLNSTESIDEDYISRGNISRNSIVSSKSCEEREVWRGISEGLNSILINTGEILGTAYWNRGVNQHIKYVHNRGRFYTDDYLFYVDGNSLSKIVLFLLKEDISDDYFVVLNGLVSMHSLLLKISRCLDKNPPSINLNRVLYRYMSRIGLELDNYKALNIYRLYNKIDKSILKHQKIKSLMNIEFDNLDLILNNVCKRVVQFNEQLNDVV